MRGKVFWPNNHSKTSLLSLDLREPCPTKRKSTPLRTLTTMRRGMYWIIFQASCVPENGARCEAMWNSRRRLSQGLTLGTEMMYCYRCELQGPEDSDLKSRAQPPLPSSHRSLPEPPILDTILAHIGNTPMVRINKLGKSEGLKCEICA